MRALYFENYALFILAGNFFSLIFSSTGAPSNLGLSVVCCNGGTPYDRNRNQVIKLGPICIATKIKSDCILYEILQNSENADLRLACQCPAKYFGDRCDEYRSGDSGSDQTTALSIANEASAISTNENSSFRIFLFIAIIPLTFALLAGFGAFMCRMCFCDCFALQDYCRRCWSKDPYNLESSTDMAAEAEDDRLNAAYRYQLSTTDQSIPDEQHRLNRQIIDDPPPFDTVCPNTTNTGAAGARSQEAGSGARSAIITMQPKPDDMSQMKLESVHRKNSPPPPYSKVVDGSLFSKDVSTQTALQNI